MNKFLQSCIDGKISQMFYSLFNGSGVFSFVHVVFFVGIGTARPIHLFFATLETFLFELKR